MLDDPEQVHVFLMGMGAGWLATVLVRAMFPTVPRKNGPGRVVRIPPPPRELTEEELQLRRPPISNAPRPSPRTVVHVHRFEGPFGSVARDALGCMICRTCGATLNSIEDEQTVIDDRGL